MSDTPAAYSFVPWLRRGIGTQIRRKDGDPAVARVSLPITLSVERVGGAEPASTTIALVGPGDVKALDPRAVLRTWPRRDVHDAETNRFPLVELSEPDLPWRYTPVEPHVDRLRPWLVLIVLADAEIDAWEAPTKERPLEVVSIRHDAPLPDLAQSWAWAHVQVIDDTDLTTTELVELVDTPRVLARLLCPRRLDPQTPYTACLVPAFERGRLAGLRETIPDADGAPLDAGAPAWTDAPVPRRLPVYYRWRFQTGVAGDFESLVRALRPRRLPATVGLRDLDVASPGLALRSASSTPLQLGGALLSPEAAPRVWDAAERSAFVSELAALLDRPADLLAAPATIRVVAPPLYGRWHAARDRITGSTGWFATLNESPVNRVVAGLGTQVVQQEQRHLVASAWQQIGRVREINAQLARAQLAREASARLHERHFASARFEHVVALTAPVHGRVATTTATIRHVLAGSPLARGLLDPQLRRLVRPRSRIGRRIGPQTALVARVNAGALVAAAAPPRPPVMMTMSRLSATRIPDVVRDHVPVLAPVFRGATRAHLARPPRLSRTFAATEPAAGTHVPIASGPADARSATALLDAAKSLAVEWSLAPPRATPPAPAALASVAQTVIEELDPRRTIVAAMLSRLRLSPGAAWHPVDPLETIMAAPEFPQPMYEPLRDLSQDWLMPGLEQVPANTVAIARTNQAFVEAYMVGLSHELARELRWNEYPTDQRGTYFRQFWDVRGHFAAAGDAITPGELLDIEPIHTWKTNALGANSSRRPPPGGEHLVILIRGELLRRYPNALVYACQAKLDTDGLRTITDVEKHPVFRGTLYPDLTFFGLELSLEQARGGTAPDDLGWFIVIQEQPTEPSFGLDVAGATFAGSVPTWNDLSWSHLARSAEELAGMQYIDLDRELPDTRTVVDSVSRRWHAETGLGERGARASDLAYITLQRPVRIAIHADDMLPRITP
ncbi:MAG TPA: hypothetical protein VFQ53_02515 [Kofleriaceae bacterium]|nr:hypothetical protein [Kofleriaceae bacterium]